MASEKSNKNKASRPRKRPGKKLPAKTEADWDELRADIPTTLMVTPKDVALAWLLFDRQTRFSHFELSRLGDDARTVATVGLDTLKSMTRLLAHLVGAEQPKDRGDGRVAHVELEGAVKSLIDAHAKVQAAVFRAVNRKDRLRGGSAADFLSYRLLIQREKLVYQSLKNDDILNQRDDVNALLQVALTGETPNRRWPMELASLAESVGFLAQALRTRDLEAIRSALDRDEAAWGRAAAVEAMGEDAPPVQDLSRVAQQQRWVAEVHERVAALQSLLAALTLAPHQPSEAGVGWALRLAVERHELRGVDDKPISLLHRIKIAEASEERILSDDPP